MPQYTRTAASALVRSSSAFGYVKPGSVLILAASVGLRSAGLVGALAATPGVFLMSWAMAAATAQQLQRFMWSRWLRGFGRGAGPAAVGLLGVTAVAISRQSFASWPYPLIAVLSLFLTLRTKIHPFLILASATAVGAALGGLSPGGIPQAFLWSRPSCRFLVPGPWRNPSSLSGMRLAFAQLRGRCILA